jgi:hypothetical protein
MARGSGIVGLTILLLRLAWIYDLFIAHKQNRKQLWSDGRHVVGFVVFVISRLLQQS